MKPSWENAPEWAKWLAMDEDGIWAWFQNKPVIKISKFVGGYWNWKWKDNMIACSKSDKKKHPDWQSTLEKRPPLDKKQG